MSQPPTQNQPELRIGCAMWANRDWVGPYFPTDTPSGSELDVYQTWCNTVEGNTTFYATPSTEAVARWADQTNDDFRFCFKLPKHITHEKRLRSTQSDLEAFLDRIEPLGQRLGPVQIQLPASFGPSNLETLATFVEAVPRHIDWAVEVRHADFFAGGTSERPLNDLLAEHGIDRVILDSRALFAAPPITPVEQETWEAKPRLPVRPVATASQPLVRLIGQTDLTQSLQHWQPWVTKLAQWLRVGLRPHVFTHTPDNRQAPELARLLWDQIRAEVPELAPPPHPLTAGTQTSLDV